MTSAADNKVDSYKLIDLVRQRPVLYDELSPEYQQYRQRQRAWNEVSRILKQPGKFVNDLMRILYTN